MNQYVAYVVAVHLAAWASLWTANPALFKQTLEALDLEPARREAAGWQVSAPSRKEKLQRALHAVDIDATLKDWRALTTCPSTSFAVQQYALTYKREPFVSIKITNLHPSCVNIYDIENCPRFKAWKQRYPVLDSPSVKWVYGEFDQSVAVWATNEVAMQLPEWLATLDPKARASVTVIKKKARQAASDGARRTSVVPLLVTKDTTAASVSAANGNLAVAGSPARSWASLVDRSGKAQITARPSPQKENAISFSTNTALLQVIDELKKSNADLMREVASLRAQINHPLILNPQPQPNPQPPLASQSQQQQQQQQKQKQAQPKKQAQLKKQTQPHPPQSPAPQQQPVNTSATQLVTSSELDDRLHAFRHSLRSDIRMIIQELLTSSPTAPADQAPMVVVVP